MTGRETSAEIDAAAADWAVRVDRAPLSEEEQAALDTWLARDTRRLGAYARARAMFAHARRAKALGADFDPDTYACTDDGGAGERPKIAVPDAIDDGLSRRRVLAIGGSAAIAAGVLGVAGFGWQAAVAQTYTTGRGEIRLVPLADGSSMTLNTESDARVHYGAYERRVELVEGEALFDVIEDMKRPFLVIAGATNVRAVGSSFSVRRIGTAPVQVVVRQGGVEVLRPLLPATPPQRVGANMRAIVPEAAPLVKTDIAPAEVGRALAWRDGMLSFEDMPLDQAVGEFARYSDVRIHFADPAIGSETVTGLYAANNPAGFAQAVATSLDLRADSTPDGIVLRR